MSACERLREAYVHREFGEDEAFDFDTHLLACDACWTAVHEERRGALMAQSLHLAAPLYLSERVRFAVNALARSDAMEKQPGLPKIAADRRCRTHSRRVRLIVLGMMASVAFVLLWSGASRFGDRPTAPAADQIVSFIGTLASNPSSPGAQGGLSSEPHRDGINIRVNVAGQPMQITRYHVGRSEVVAAISPRSFPIPSRVETVTSGNSTMAWMKTTDGVTVYCIGSQRVLLASRGGVGAILTTAQALHLI